MFEYFESIKDTIKIKDDSFKKQKNKSEPSEIHVKSLKGA